MTTASAATAKFDALKAYIDGGKTSARPSHAGYAESAGYFRLSAY